MKPSLQLRIGHQLTMTPQLQQAIRLLQLSATDLKNEIQEALETNSMLEALESPSDNMEASEDPLPHNADNVLEQDENEVVSWELQTLTRNPFRSNETTGNKLETLNSSQGSLQDHLFWQMQLTPFSENDRLIATTLIDAINEHGFLVCSLDEILDTIKPVCNVDISEVEAVLHRIQRFDPIGVGARNLSECLKVQLDNLPFSPWRNKAKDLVCSHLELLGKRDYPALKRRLGLTMDQLREVIYCVLSLNPRPGTHIGESASEYIIPDVFTYKKQGKWEVELNPDCTPSLQINRHYAQFIKRANASPDNQFLRHQLQEARWFLKSLENRNTTLLKVARCIVNKQQNFLDYGEKGMKPLTLYDIAQALELHASTISRVTTQKVIHTPRGSFELKFFFSSHVTTEQGDTFSATAIRAFIKKTLASENPNKPLSDHKLAQLLENLGIKIARRTVAKYRENLKIPPSNERKKIISHPIRIKQCK